MKDYFDYQGDFRNLSREDLEYLFLLLKDYKLKYRDHLGLDQTLSFGVELEFEDVLLYYVERQLHENVLFQNWFVHEDHSCSFKMDDFVVGGEVSSAVLHDTKIDWKILSEVLFILQKLKAHATDQTSLHVHVGAHIFGDHIENVIRFIKLWCIFEPVIFKFAYGDGAYPRPKILAYACPIATATKLKCKHYPQFFETIFQPCAFHYDKKWAVNFKNYRDLSLREVIGNTIEIRCANGTLKRNTIQNTIYFYLKLMLYVVSDQYDEELINYLFQNLKERDFSSYQETYVEDVLMLVDLIFDCSFDKINFLKQYIKKREIVFTR